MTEVDARPRTSRGDLVAGLLFALLGAAVGARAVALHVGSAFDPQPGFFPFIGGTVLVLLGALLGLRALLPRREGAGKPSVDALGPPAALVLGLAIYATLLEWGGYPLLTALVVLLVLRVQKTRWLPAMLVSVLLAAGSHGLFVKLGVPLPLGRIFGR